MQVQLFSSRLSSWLIAGALVLLPLVVFANAVSNPFLIDDHDAIVEHPDVTRIGGLVELWGHDYWAGRTEDANLYRPITVLSYWLNQRLTPNSPAGFRIFNILLLGGIGSALFVFLKRRAGPVAAALAAGLFVVHPVHGEVINHIVGRADLLATLGIVGFLAIQQNASEHRWTTRRIVAAALLALVALGSKEIGFAIIPVALVQAWLGGGSTTKQTTTPNSQPNATGLRHNNALLFALGLPLIIAIAARLAVVGISVDYSPGTDDLTGNPLRGLALIDRLPDAMAIFGWHVKQLLAPALSFNHSPGPSGVGAWHTGAWARALLMSLLVAAWVLLLRKRHWLSVPATLFLSNYLIVGNLLIVTGAYAANRLTLAGAAAAAMGLAAALSAVISRGYREMLAGVLACAVVIMIAGAVAFSHNSDWSSELSRMQADADAQPDNPVALYWFGQASLQADAPARAMPPLEKAHALEPTSVQSTRGLADAYLYAGQNDQAWSMYQKLLSMTGKVDQRGRINAALAAFNAADYAAALSLSQDLDHPEAKQVADLSKRAIEEKRGN